VEKGKTAGQNPETLLYIMRVGGAFFFEGKNHGRKAVFTAPDEPGMLK